MFETVLDEYYEWRGWERRTGLQTESRLASLGMEDVAEVLAADGALARASA
jgi:aldehyde:ferredoxin oxidoreductase